MVHVKVDQPACQGHARCHAVAPQLFVLNDDGYSALEDVEVGPELEREARDGALSCPEQAITVTS